MEARLKAETGRLAGIITGTELVAAGPVVGRSLSRAIAAGTPRRRPPFGYD
jgi:hypothetical protein